MGRPGKLPRTTGGEPGSRVYDTPSPPPHIVQELANGELCIAMSWSSDYESAMARARAANISVHLAFTIPREGSSFDYDALLIPAQAPHAVAGVTNAIYYGNSNRDANAYVVPWILADPALYPPPELEARMYFSLPPTPAIRRLRTRAWTRIKTGH